MSVMDSIGDVDENGLPLRLRTELDRVDLVLSKTHLLLQSDDDTKYKRALATADQDVASLLQMYEEETKRLNLLKEGRGNAYDALSKIEEQYRTCIQTIDTSSLWDVPSIQRLVDDYETKKR